MVRRVLTLVIVAITAALAGLSAPALGSSAYRYYASAAAALHFGDPDATSTTPITNVESRGAGATTDSAGVSRGEAVALRLVVATEVVSPSGTPNFDNPGESPGPGWEWRGPADKGSWYNPETGESLHPDLEHPEPIGPHYDYRAPDGQFYRIFRDGTVVPK
jgi:hypothetical protein